MINIVVCDDEKAFQFQIKKLIDLYAPKDFEYDVIMFSSGEEFINFTKDDPPVDIVFMDIEMQKITGIEAITQFKKQYPAAIVFFVTSHNSYITDIFRLGTFQFLQKPICERDFAIDFSRAIARYARNHKLLEIKTKATICNIAFSSIFYVEIKHKQITIFTKKGDILTIGRIKDYENKLAGFGFVNCHKSIIVNLQYVENIDLAELKLFYCDRLLPISRNYRTRFLQAYSSFSKGKKI